MLYKVKVRVTRHLLGNVPDHVHGVDTPKGRKPVYRFDRDESGGWALDLRHWGGLFSNAAESLGLDLHWDCLRFPDAIMLPSLQLYMRRWSANNGKELKERWHEAIFKGTVLTFYVMVRASGENNESLKRPNHEQLTNILKFIGDWEGISPFGSRFGYGRYKLEDLCAVGRGPIDGVEPTT